MRKIDDFTEKYRDLETREGGQEHYDISRKECLALIPPNWFVWSDELQDAHSYYYDHENLSMSNEKEGDRKLVWDPPQLNDAELIMECLDFKAFDKESDETSRHGNVAQKSGYKNSIREEKKRKTLQKHESWQRKAEELKRARPGLSKASIARQISKEAIAQESDSETIRKIIVI